MARNIYFVAIATPPLAGIVFFGGPNQVWHIDGYDKLTPFGLSIHGCIDGYDA